MNEKHDFQIKERITINKDSNLLKLCFRNNYIWLANVYLCYGKTSKVQKLFGKLLKYIPQNELSQLLVLGDFNVDARSDNDELC